jgi:hypothetical protein
MIHDPVSDTGIVPTKTSRRLGWLAVCAAGLALVLVGVELRQGGTVRWTSWALPILIVANVSASIFGVLRPWPRISRLFPFVSIGLALVIIVALLDRSPFR